MQNKAYLPKKKKSISIPTIFFASRLWWKNEAIKTKPESFYKPAWSTETEGHWSGNTYQLILILSLLATLASR